MTPSERSGDPSEGGGIPQGAGAAVDRAGRYTYVFTMQPDDEPMDVVPARFPELALLAWNRDPERPIPGAEALSLYERNWRHVDTARLTEAEATLIRRLAERFGGGHLLVPGLRYPMPLWIKGAEPYWPAMRHAHDGAGGPCALAGRAALPGRGLAARVPAAQSQVKCQKSHEGQRQHHAPRPRYGE